MYLGFHVLFCLQILVYWGSWPFNFHLPSLSGILIRVLCLLFLSLFVVRDKRSCSFISRFNIYLRCISFMLFLISRLGFLATTKDTGLTLYKYTLLSFHFFLLQFILFPCISERHERQNFCNSKIPPSPLLRIKL